MINIESLEKWTNTTSSHIYIAQQKFHRNAELFLENYPNFKNSLESCLNKEFFGLCYSIRNKKGVKSQGITANSLNKELRDSLKQIDSLKFEVESKNGVLFDSDKTGGFDFALFDENFNLMNFYNHCLGKNAHIHGIEEWMAELDKRPDWQTLANQLDLLNFEDLIGNDIPTEKKHPTIIGEIQFANWALAYYDLFKVLHLDNLMDLDLLVYITATGNLNSCLSDGIVNYLDMENIINKYSSILKVPIWLIGIDIKDSQQIRPSV